VKVAGSCTVELEEVISEGAGSATPMRGKFSRAARIYFNRTMPV